MLAVAGMKKYSAAVDLVGTAGFGGIFVASAQYFYGWGNYGNPIVM